MSTDKPYENREIDSKFDFIKEKLELIHDQTVKTNGRVSKSEEQIQEIKEWKSNLMGKIAALTVVGGAVWAFIANKLI